MIAETEAPDSTLGALKDLVQSEGWKLFKARLHDEWGPTGYGRTMQHAISTIPNGPDRAYEIARVAEQVDATCRAVNQLVKWPEEEIGRLGAEPKATGRGLWPRIPR